MMSSNHVYGVGRTADNSAPLGLEGPAVGTRVGDLDRLVPPCNGRSIPGLDTYEACRLDGAEPNFVELPVDDLSLARFVEEAWDTNRMSRSGQEEVTLAAASTIVDHPRPVQLKALELVRSGRMRTIARALKQVPQGAESQEEADDSEPVLPDPPFSNVSSSEITATYYRSPLGNLRRFVEARGVDAIVTYPASTARGIASMPHLADLAAHCLTDGGLLVVMVNPKFLPQFLDGLRHPELKYLDSSTVIFPKRRKAKRGGPPLSRRSMYLLLYGRPGAVLHPGGDIIGVPPPKDKTKVHLHLDRAMIPIVRRYSSTGQVVFDPAMLGRPAVGLAAQALGRHFIGADRDQYLLEMVRRRLATAGSGGTVPRQSTEPPPKLQGRFPF